MFLIISLLSLLEAYFNGDMSTWQATIDSTRWEILCEEDKETVINTEYGYIASLIDEAPTGAKRTAKGRDERNAKAKAYLDNYVAHIEDAKSFLPPSRYCMYRSAAYAYEFMMTKKLNAGIQSFRLCHDAIEANPNDPFALSLVANVDFYAPGILGGSKKKAIEEFEKARQILLTEEQYNLWWNKPATLYSLIMCYEAIGDTATAQAREKELRELYPSLPYAE